MHFALFPFLTFCKLFDIFWAGGEQVVCTGCTLVLLFALLVLDVCCQIVSYIDIYICINFAAHKTTTITSTSHWHLSFTLQRHCVLKNHWNNNINNCVILCASVRVCVCVCVFCLVDGFFSVYLTVFALHSASASTSTRAQVSTATAIELSHERVKCGLGLRFRCLFLYLIKFDLAANSLGASFRKFAFWIGNIDFCYR